MVKSFKCSKCGFEEIIIKIKNDNEDKIKKCKTCNETFNGSVRIHNKSDNHIKYKKMKDKINEINLNDIDRINLFLDSLMIAE
jgi:transcription elongation factor Elf1